MVSNCTSSKSLYARKKSFKNAICCESRVTFLNASGHAASGSSGASVQAFGSNGLILYSPERKSI